MRGGVCAFYNVAKITARRGRSSILISCVFRLIFGVWKSRLKFQVKISYAGTGFKRCCLVYDSVVEKPV